MKKYIHAYITDSGTCFKDISSWSGVETPLIITSNISEAGYENISSISYWENYSEQFDKKHQIELIYQETDWASITLEEKKIVAKYFLVDKSKRDEVFTQNEQDTFNYFKIYDLLAEDVLLTKNITNFYLTPKTIDYKREVNGRLHPKYTFDSQGWLIECEYFKNLETSQDGFGFTVYSYSDPILKYESSYIVETNGYVSSRTVTRRWYRLDGTLDTDSKITQKFYEPISARDEGKRRRRNIVNKLLVETIGLIIMTSVDLSNVQEAEADSIPFLKSVSSGLSDYYEYGTKQDTQGNAFLLKQQIIDSNYLRLDNFVPGTNNTLTIRQHLITKLSV